MVVLLCLIIRPFSKLIWPYFGGKVTYSNITKAPHKHSRLLEWQTVARINWNHDTTCKHAKQIEGLVQNYYNLLYKKVVMHQTLEMHNDLRKSIIYYVFNAKHVNQWWEWGPCETVEKAGPYKIIDEHLMSACY